MTAFLIAVAWCVGALLLGLLIGDVIARRDRHEHRAPVGDLGVARRRRNGTALAGVTVDMSLVDADRTRRERVGTTHSSEPSSILIRRPGLPR